MLVMRIWWYSSMSIKILSPNKLIISIFSSPYKSSPSILRGQGKINYWMVIGLDRWHFFLIRDITCFCLAKHAFFCTVLAHLKQIWNKVQTDRRLLGFSGRGLVVWDKMLKTKRQPSSSLFKVCFALLNPRA